MVLGDFSLTSKIAVVTGAGSGINLSFAQIAVQAGARVIVADLRLTTEAQEFLERVESKAAIFTKCDVTKRADLEALAVVSERVFGDVPDVWIAGAGVFEPPWSNFWDDTEDDGYAAIDINVTHPMKLSRIAIRTLVGKQKKGAILIVASLAGFQGTFSAPLYTASKHAVIGFVRSMGTLDALEGIKITAVCPGLVKTPLWTDHPEKIHQFGFKSKDAVGPDEVAKAMIELVTEGKYEGGTCLETSLGGNRVLGTWNVTAPASVGTAVPQELIDRNMAPMKAIIQRERGAL